MIELIKPNSVLCLDKKIEIYKFNNKECFRCISTKKHLTNFVKNIYLQDSSDIKKDFFYFIASDKNRSALHYFDKQKNIIKKAITDIDYDEIYFVPNKNYVMVEKDWQLAVFSFPELKRVTEFFEQICIKGILENQNSDYFIAQQNKDYYKFKIENKFKKYYKTERVTLEDIFLM